MLALAREGYHASQVNFSEMLDVVLYPGFWLLIQAQVHLALGEAQCWLRKDAFCRSLQSLVPEIQPEGLESESLTGVSAQAVDSDGQVPQDFLLLVRPNALHVLHAPSPAATCSLAIGARLAKCALQILAG